MKRKPYPKYKLSGVEWLGEVPEHWRTGRVSGLFRLRSGGTPSTDIADYWEGEIPWVSAKDMKSLRIADTQDHITPRAVAESATSIVPARTLLIVARSGILKHTLPVAFCERAVAINQDIKGLLPDPDRIEALYFAYWVQGHQRPLLTLWRQQGATVESLDMEKLKVATVLLPPLEEQRAIADFLDHETAKIDTLVVKKRTLIERLKEKRTALISRTVTRGLPPDAARAVGLDPHPKLKPSDIDWLGEVPEHWGAVRLNRVTVSRCDGPFGSGLKSEHYSEGGGIRVIRLQNIRCAEFDDRDTAFIDADYYGELGDHDVLAGDLLIAGLGDENNPVGRACVAPSTLGSAMVKADCFRFRLDTRKAYATYLALQLSATANALAGAMATGTTRGRMNLSSTAARVVLIPPLCEQTGIAAFLDRETAKIDALVAKIETAIERLQEYRTALITAAVTGKIDVRQAFERHSSVSTETESASIQE